MATPLPLPNKLSRDSSKTVKFKLISAEMGDSYTQEAPKGLNPKVDNWNIAWVGLTLAERLAVESVLDTVGVWGLLSWTPCYEVTKKYFKLDKDFGYNTKHVGGNNDFKITCKLIERFDVNP